MFRLNFRDYSGTLVKEKVYGVPYRVTTYEPGPKFPRHTVTPKPPNIGVKRWVKERPDHVKKSSEEFKVDPEFTKTD